MTTIGQLMNPTIQVKPAPSPLPKTPNPNSPHRPGCAACAGAEDDSEFRVTIQLFNTASSMMG